jgi:DNA-binding XRE family transcriptional regulator
MSALLLFQIDFATSILLLFILNLREMSIIVSNIVDELQHARKAAGLTHDMLALRAGVSRMTVQRTEAGKIDPRLSTLLVLARALGMDLMLVPKALRADLEDFVRSGGRFLGQPSGIGAPPSLVDELLQPDEPAQRHKPAQGRR